MTDNSNWFTDLLCVDAALRVFNTEDNMVAASLFSSLQPAALLTTIKGKSEAKSKSKKR